MSLTNESRTMAQIEINRNRELIERKKRRLHELRKQAAETGIATDPCIVNEIKDIQEDIEKLEEQIVEMMAQNGSPSTSVKPLCSPLEKYDPFFKRLFERRAMWDRGEHRFQTNILTSLAHAIRAKHAAIVRSNTGTWEVTAAENESAVDTMQDILQHDAALIKMLEQAARYAIETKKVNPAIYTNTVQGTLPTSDRVCVFIVLSSKYPIDILLLYEAKPECDIDVVLSVSINHLLQVTNNLTTYKSSESIETTAYNTLKSNFGYVSDFMYNQQLSLFKERLNTMVVYFEPIISLSKTPYICRWEALARDPITKRAPTDLFEAAEIWGKQFQLELDLYFLQIAIQSYTPPNTERAHLLPLSINVYPESLVRQRYKHALHEIKEKDLLPLEKLTLEISEKAPFPIPEENDNKQDKLQWFRDQLKLFIDLGISFAIDDFGVGYASTSRLSRIEPEFIKIDRDALLHHLGGFTIDYARNLVRESLGKMKTIVEGFDDDSRLRLSDLYHRLNIRFVQGHLLGKAEPTLYKLRPEDEERIRCLLEE